LPNGYQCVLGGCQGVAMQLLTVCVLSFLFPFLPFPTNHIAMWWVSKAI